MHAPDPIASRRFRREMLLVGGLSTALVICAWCQWLRIDLTESLGFATGAVCVWLVTRGNIWNWPIGLANNIFFAILFWRTRLFADFGLQGVYFALGLWGWWQWLHGGPDHSRLRVSRASRAEWMALALFLIAGTWLLRDLLIAVNGAAPFWDSLTTILCLAAQYLMCRKRFESWWFWITADVIYVPLYLSRQLPLIALLYAGFIILCIIGLRRWRLEIPAS
jgi:nicotinamide mononucleotide transporter